MSRLVGVYRQKSATFATRVSDEPHMTVRNVAKPAQVRCWSGERNTRPTA